MATNAPAAPPAWFRIAALLAILWNAFGVFQYLTTTGLFGDTLASLSDAQRAAAEAMPDWLYIAFAIGVLAGLVGSVNLLLRKRSAVRLLALSLAGLAVLEGWILFASGNLEAHGGPALPVTILAVSALLLWLAIHAQKRGWLA
ncbi:MAG TPA: hypothetical protein VGB48_07245 [Allosphingosinicella sp.]|jgi:uncharacterized membrane protein